MSKKKKKREFSNLPSSVPLITPLPQQPLTDLNFDGIEDRIRGEEKLMEQKVQKEKEVRSIEKDLKSAEVDKKLEELRRQLGLENTPKKKR